MGRPYLKMIADLKCKSFDAAQQKALPIISDSKERIGSLIPVGPWILADKAKIQDICDWRQKAMRFFLTQFDSTYERTLGYLKNLSIGQEGRMFFLIYDTDNNFIGHIGIANADGKMAELDNLMRGKPGGDPKLIYFAEKALLDWAFGDLGLTHMSLRILSFNVLAINLHAEFGFKTTEKLPLKKSEKDGLIVHDPVDAAEANVRYTNVIMEVTRDEFERKL